MMNGKLLEIVACPTCHGRLEYDEQHQRLICRFEKLAYPIKKRHSGIIGGTSGNIKPIGGKVT